MYLPSEQCAVINQDRYIERIRFRMNWLYDNSMDQSDEYWQLMLMYYEETDCAWDPVTGRSVEVN